MYEVARPISLPERYNMRQKVHERVDISYSYVDRLDLPARLQDLYCHCGNYSAVNITREKRVGPPVCNNCRCVVGWFFYKCVKCEEFFIKDFRHPKFCPHYPTCWEHTPGLPWRYCVEHTADPDEFEFYSIIVPPVGLNPKQFSEEELANVFVF